MQTKDLEVGDLLIEIPKPNVKIIVILIARQRIWDKPPHSIGLRWYDLKHRTVDYMWFEEERELPQHWCVLRNGNVIHRGSRISEDFEYGI